MSYRHGLDVVQATCEQLSLVLTEIDRGLAATPTAQRPFSSECDSFKKLLDAIDSGLAARRTSSFRSRRATLDELRDAVRELTELVAQAENMPVYRDGGRTQEQAELRVYLKVAQCRWLVAKFGVAT